DADLLSIGSDHADLLGPDRSVHTKLWNADTSCSVAADPAFSSATVAVPDLQSARAMKKAAGKSLLPRPSGGLTLK
ncbi:MAG: hypothetical protein PVF87_13140, partial [Acidimicrobiia bacterium]